MDVSNMDTLPVGVEGTSLDADSISSGGFEEGDKVASVPGPSSSGSENSSSGGKEVKSAEESACPREIAERIFFLLQSSKKPKNLDSEGANGGETDEESEYEEVTDPEILKAMREWYAETTEESIIQRRLLFDEDGHEKRLAELLKFYNDLYVTLDPATNYHYFKRCLLKLDNLRLLTKKNVLLIESIEKANQYLDKMKKMLTKHTKEFRTLLGEQRRKNDELQKKREEAQRINVLMQKVSETADVETLKKEIAKCQEDLKKLEERNAELELNLDYRKTHMTYVCELIKKLHEENDMEVRGKAVEEADENNVFSDFDLE